MSRQGVERPRGSSPPVGVDDEAVARHYHALKAPTLARLAAKLRARRIPHSPDDLEDHYQLAWLALLDAHGRQPIVNPAAFLAHVTYRRALDELRRADARARAELAAAQPAIVEDTLLHQAERRRELREFASVLASRLQGRARSAAALCYLHGLSRAAAGRALGLSSTRMKRIMDEASRDLATGVEQIAAGEHCDRRRSTNTAFALGVLDPSGRRFSEARAHLRHCPRCRRDVVAVRHASAARAGSAPARSLAVGQRRGGRPDDAGRPPSGA